MNPLRSALAGALVLGALLLAAAPGCGSSSSSTAGDAGGEGGNPADCPVGLPSAGSPCVLASSTNCNYGCGQGGPAEASCQNGAWRVFYSEMSCPASTEAGAGCRSDTECPSSEYCAATFPGGITYCATSGTPKCSVDADCADAGPGGAGYICENYLCPSGTGRGCFAPCSDATCGPTAKTGLVCGASGRCEAKTCQGGGDCPTNFDCTAGRCQRRACTSDATCQGFCVDKLCTDALGTCEQPRG